LAVLEKEPERVYGYNEGEKKKDGNESVLVDGDAARVGCWRLIRYGSIS
jgi:hypothetical protein